MITDVSFFSDWVEFNVLLNMSGTTVSLFTVKTSGHFLHGKFWLLLQERWKCKSWDVPRVRRWTSSAWRLWMTKDGLPQQPRRPVLTSAICCRPSRPSVPDGGSVSWRHESSACRRTSVRESVPSTSESTVSRLPARYKLLYFYRLQYVNWMIECI